MSRDIGRVPFHSEMDPPPRIIIPTEQPVSKPYEAETPRIVVPAEQAVSNSAWTRIWYHPLSVIPAEAGIQGWGGDPSQASSCNAAAA